MAEFEDDGGLEPELEALSLGLAAPLEDNESDGEGRRSHLSASGSKKPLPKGSPKPDEKVVAAAGAGKKQCRGCGLHLPLSEFPKN
jgi:hypothetical protein